MTTQQEQNAKVIEQNATLFAAIEAVKKAAAVNEVSVEEIIHNIKVYLYIKKG